MYVIAVFRVYGSRILLCEYSQYFDTSGPAVFRYSILLWILLVSRVFQGYVSEYFKNWQYFVRWHYEYMQYQYTLNMRSIFGV